MNTSSPSDARRTATPYSNAAARGWLRENLLLLRYKMAAQAALPAMKVRAFKHIRQRLETHLGSVRGLTLVEVGCGQMLSNVKLFSAMGSRVIGVDPELPPQSLSDVARVLGAMGVERTLKSLLSDLLFRRAFDRGLQEHSGLSLQDIRPRLHRCGAERLPLADASADACISDNVFEHLSDVPAVVAEMKRVLRPGGVACVIIHPFAAYSGGHNLRLFAGDGVADEEVPPWDHLRDARFASATYLNRLREAQYREIFDGALQTVEWERIGPEGERFLTDDVLAALPGYSRDELLTGKLVYVGRKPVP